MSIKEIIKRIVLVILVAAFIFFIISNIQTNKKLTEEIVKNTCLVDCLIFYDDWHCKNGPAQGDMNLCRQNFCNCIAGCFGGINPCAQTQSST